MSERLKNYYEDFYREKRSSLHSLDYGDDFFERLLHSGTEYARAISMANGMMREERDGPFRVLEIGVGTGVMLQWFRKQGCEPVGVDISEGLAKTFAEKGFEMRVVDLNEAPLPFDPGRFDLVVALDVIEHVIDPIAFMGEIHRVCAPAGRAIVSTANSRALKSLWKLAVRGEFPWTSEEKTGWDCGHLHYFTSSDVAGLGARFGFKAVRVEGASPRVGGVRGVLKSLAFASFPSAWSREFLSGSFVILFQK